jgi:predicted O-linked N-acetylglucosamine transferase (SPINDLY family)
VVWGVNDLGAKLEQARRLFEAGKFEQAKVALQRLLSQAPGNADACSAMAVVLTQLGHHEQALFHAQRAAEARPRDAGILANLGNSLGILKRGAEARAAFEGALAIAPDLGMARVGLVSALRSMAEFSLAMEHVQEAMRRDPGDGALPGVEAALLLSMGRAHEAVVRAKKWRERWPRDVGLAGVVANAINYDEEASPEEVLAAHREFGEVVRAGVKEKLPAPTNVKEAERPLKVGLLSFDLKKHSVAFFVEPLLRHVDRGRLSVTCYSTSATEDEVSARLKSLAAGWRAVAGLDDAALAKRIRADGIDVLIETSGVTLGHRLGVMAMRPAPVQATWCGYPATTGLSEVDYRIVDSKTDPVGAEKWCVERLVRVDPCFLCYGPGEAPLVGRAPITQGRDRWHLAFGSFNAGMKLNAKVIGVWARLLKRVPGSGLILKAFDFKDAPTRKRIEDAFVAEGVEAGRVEVMPPVATAAEHLRAYERVDIALDTFPYAGTTTTFEALWMGCRW